jgi:hypothetical protein
MEGASASSERSNGTGTGSPRQAACLACRRSKVRCHRKPGDLKCRRCQSTNAECTIPDFHIGRQKGIKKYTLPQYPRDWLILIPSLSKRSGLDKAVHRIEQALERSNANGGRLEDEQAALHLQQLLSKTQGILPRSTVSGDLMAGVQVQPQSASPHSQGHLSSFSRDHMGSSLTSTSLSAQDGGDDGYALEDAENPLQLLARASDLPMSPRNMPAAPSHLSPVAVPDQAGQKGNQSDNQDLRTFFGPLSPNLDTGEDIDPIDMGYVTPNETDVLFNL